jgi:hypothetical protein
MLLGFALRAVLCSAPALTPESYWDVCSPSSTKTYEEQQPVSKQAAGAANGNAVRISSTHATQTMAAPAVAVVQPAAPIAAITSAAPPPPSISGAAVLAAQPAPAYVQHAPIEHYATSQELELERQMLEEQGASMAL